jgi:hypothetical protein
MSLVPIVLSENQYKITSSRRKLFYAVTGRGNSACPSPYILNEFWQNLLESTLTVSGKFNYVLFHSNTTTDLHELQIEHLSFFSNMDPRTIATVFARVQAALF